MHWTDFNLIDIVALLYIIYSVVRGWKRGLSGELARLISLAIIVIFGWQGYAPLGEKLGEVTRLSEPSSRFAGFFIAIFLATVTMVLLRLILRNIMEFTFKGPLERVGGMVAGGLRSGFLIAAIVIAASLTPISYLRITFGEESRIGSILTHTLLPAYQHMATEYPDLGLPALPDEPAPAEPADEEDEEREEVGGEEEETERP
jgi:uncharacterized membrane protein required for colicin V production